MVATPAFVALEDPGLAESPVTRAPFSLTASDGTGLTLLAVRAEAVVDDPLALSQVHMTFENPTNRLIEGRFTFTLPEGAALSRFAMKVNGRWQEGEVVEKQRARVTYEEFLHRRVDPALLEQGAGNEVSVRIFPIPAGAEREILVAYSETLPSSEPYRLRLGGLPAIGLLDARIFVGAKMVLSARTENEVPAGDLVLPPSSWARGPSSGVRAEKAIVARVRLPLDGAASEAIDSAVVLVDTSASRVLDLGQEVAALRALAQGLPKDARLRVACFDQTIAPIYEGPASGLGEDHLAKIKSRRALGASDLERALRWAHDTTKLDPSLTHRLIVMSDGVATAGEQDEAALAELASRLSARGFSRADALSIGGIKSEPSLERIVKGGLPSAGVVVALEKGPQAVLAKLTTKTLPAQPVTVPGASWSYPKQVFAQPGDEITVYAELGVATASPTVKVGASTFEPTLIASSAPLVARTLAVAKIRELEATEGDGARQKIIELSTQHRVVSEHTSMLVLETERDYQQFKIDRTSKVDVLGVVDGRAAVLSQDRFSGELAVTSASPGVAAPAPVAATASGNLWGSEIGDAFGAGGLGLSGIGEGGGGVGLGNVGTAGASAGVSSGASFGLGHSLPSGGGKAPKVRMGATQVSGRLPPEVVQRIVRQNFGRIRACYQEALRTSPSLQGRVVVRFKIAKDGSVTDATGQGSDLPSPAVIACIVQVFRSLSFPAPESGTVIVSYPIMLAEGSDTEAPPASLPIPVARRSASLLDPPAPPPAAPYSGAFGEVMAALAKQDKPSAWNAAWKFRAASPTDVLSFVALGEAAEAAGEQELAARAYGSLIDLWSYRVDMRRFAAQRLERIGGSSPMSLAVDSYDKALADRPDHVTSGRGRALALLKVGKPRQAFEAVEAALAVAEKGVRSVGALEVLRADLGLAGAAWVAAEPDKRLIILDRLGTRGANLEVKPSLRFVLVWETDTNDVDLHVTDAEGGHAYYSHRSLSSGGMMSPDVTTGYGPEMYAVSKDKGDFAFPFGLSVHYFARGAMGFGMGKVEIIRHDGAGQVSFEDRPFVLMTDHAKVDLGAVTATGKKG